MTMTLEENKALINETSLTPNYDSHGITVSAAYDGGLLRIRMVNPHPTGEEKTDIYLTNAEASKLWEYLHPRFAH